MDSSAHELYHILNTGTFTYCLICMESICDKISSQSEDNPINVHLRGLNHKENVKFLFKLCIPDWIDEEHSTEDYNDIMTRSVFDISHLLGKETCYICCKNKKHLVCLLCREEVSEMEFPCKKIKKRIINHLQSDRHLKSVKDTNWIYHFNSIKSFFRFHKSRLYCSICKQSFQIEESNLMQFADSHLKNLHSFSHTEGAGEVTQEMSQAKAETTTSEVVGLGSSNSSSNSSNENSENLLNKLCFPVKTKKPKRYTCHICLGDIEVTDGGVRHSIDKHCMNYHLKCFQVEGPSLFKEIVCFNQSFLNHKVILKKYPGIKVLSDCVPVFGNNAKYIQIFEKICFCSLCSVMISFDSDPNNLLRNFSTHFHSAAHMKVLKKKGETGFDKALKKKTKDLKRLQQSPKASDSKKSKKKKVE